MFYVASLLSTFCVDTLILVYYGPLILVYYGPLILVYYGPLLVYYGPLLVYMDPFDIFMLSTIGHYAFNIQTLLPFC